MQISQFKSNGPTAPKLHLEGPEPNPEQPPGPSFQDRFSANLNENSQNYSDLWAGPFGGGLGFRAGATAVQQLGGNFPLQLVGGVAGAVVGYKAGSQGIEALHQKADAAQDPKVKTALNLAGVAATGALVGGTLGINPLGAALFTSGGVAGMSALEAKFNQA